MSNKIKRGKYQHFKGKFYQVLYIAANTETLEDMVVYQALYPPFHVWVRPASMWLEHVERDNYSGPRFTPIELDDDYEPFPKSIQSLKPLEVADALQQCIYTNCEQCPARKCFEGECMHGINRAAAKLIREKYEEATNE